MSHQLVGLIKRRRLNMQPVGGYTCQSTIVQHHDRVCMIGKPFQRQEGVVWLNNYVAFLCVRKHGVRLYQFLRELVIQAL